MSAGVCRVAALLLPLVCWAMVGRCSPPPVPIRCLPGNSSCTVTNGYGVFPDRSTCRAAAVVFPTSEKELLAAVARASRTKTKIKVVSRHSHSIPKLVCPDGNEGLLISTRYLDRVVRVDGKAMTMTVEGGMRLRELIQAAAGYGLALPHSPYWWGVTIGGLLSTGSHGSSLWGKGGAVHEYVVGMRLVTPAPAAEGYAIARNLDASTPKEFNAARVSLGVLGVISQITLQLQPMFKRSITKRIAKDFDLAERVVQFGKEHQFASINWYPGHGEVIYRLDDQVDVQVPGDGINDFIGFRAQPTLLLAINRIAEEADEVGGAAAGKCLSSQLQASIFRSSGEGLSNDASSRIFTGYPVVGYHNRLQSSGGCLLGADDGLLTACAWDPRIRGEFFFESSFKIPLRSVPSFVRDIQRLRDLDPAAFCEVELYNGMLLRYLRASDAYLGEQEDSVAFDITYYRSRDARRPRLNGAVMDEVEQMAVSKYGGRPHWGKNRDAGFVGVAGKYARLPEFLEVMREFDPDGLFSSEWTDRLLGRRSSVAVHGEEGCALEGLCVCSDDAHCGGFTCGEGKIYKKARVCAAGGRRNNNP